MHLLVVAAPRDGVAVQEGVLKERPREFRLPGPRWPVDDQEVVPQLFDAVLRLPLRNGRRHHGRDEGIAKTLLA
eukprot:1856075-Prymnesium_polylepis.1